MQDGLFSLASLATVGGCSLAVYLCTQLTKELIDKLIHIPTDILAIMYAFMFLVLSQLATGANVFDWKLYFLAFPNAILISLTAAQIQSKAVQIPGTSIKSLLNKSNTTKYIKSNSSDVYDESLAVQLSNSVVPSLAYSMNTDAINDNTNENEP